MNWYGPRLIALGLLVTGAPALAPCQAQEPASTSSVAHVTEDPLLQDVEKAIQISRRRFLSSETHTPWQIMHGILALRHDYQIKINGKREGALEYISQNPRFGGQPWFQKTQHGGRAHPFTVPYVFEGHPNQFFAILTMSDLPRDYKFATDRGPITVADLIKNAQMEVNTQVENTWTLWALSHYLPPETTWVNKWGQRWGMETLVHLETRNVVTQSACGGTHGLFALAYSRRMYQKTGRPLRGIWLEADQKIRRHVQLARALQNSDGSFSANYFRGRQHSTDHNKRIETSGHTLEFLMMALSDEELKQPWVRKAVASVAKDLIDSGKSAVKVGPLYHALDALVIYQERTMPATNTAATPKNLTAPKAKTGPAPKEIPGTAKVTPNQPAIIKPPKEVKPLVVNTPVTREQSSLEREIKELEISLKAAEAELETVEALLNDADTAASTLEAEAQAAREAANEAKSFADQAAEKARLKREAAETKQTELDAKKALAAAMRRDLILKRSELKKQVTAKSVSQPKVTQEETAEPVTTPGEITLPTLPMLPMNE